MSLLKRNQKISVTFLKKAAAVAGIFFGVFAFIFFFEVYIPRNSNSNETITYSVEKGWSTDKIANDLQKMGLIKSSYFFQLYTTLSFQYSRLQAGDYELSPRMSTYEITKKMARGDSLKNRIVILEGWDIADIDKYLESKKICKNEEFESLVKKDYSSEFDFLNDKPKSMSLEGFLFPDTYDITDKSTCEGVLNMLLANFNQKLTSDLRLEISTQKKTIFDVVIMASLIEKEVRTMSDKKIVSGILWKRLKVGMPLQLDATINYITGKSDPAVSIKDTFISSPYNTYRNKGLPKGPISNPGINSILAALYPTETKYWYYLTDGKTIFSETYKQHKANMN
jgi:UPF0755 protein